jgi:hypothetical protein
MEIVAWFCLPKTSDCKRNTSSGRSAKNVPTITFATCLCQSGDSPLDTQILLSPMMFLTLLILSLLLKAKQLFHKVDSVETLLFVYFSLKLMNGLLLALFSGMFAANNISRGSLRNCDFYSLKMFSGYSTNSFCLFCSMYCQWRFFWCFLVSQCWSKLAAITLIS